MHRTTIPLEGHLERELRQLAAREKKSFKELVNDLLKKGLKIYREMRKGNPEFVWHKADAIPNPDFDPANRATYLDLLSKKMP